MIAPDVLDLRGVAQVLGVTYDWLQRHWRTEPGFPPPFKGAGKGQRPLWARAVILEYRLGRRWAAEAPAQVAPSAAFAVANDLVHHARQPDVDALLAAAGG
ncbi:hypothetical protein SH203_02866 [Brevundimonas sp. SH203]|uniref:hypothetical protein n=1 Tax=Brevundimonas sp. SH203 TaxID=345167 RepID=UPI0009D05D9C|nr:hypothetical protein [Brevundimonas sp. SH203]GAW42450.1 hypothetical protein SH203_02866 [Brevundimonas sp. SH203]